MQNPLFPPSHSNRESNGARATFASFVIGVLLGCFIATASFISFQSNYRGPTPLLLQLPSQNTSSAYTGISSNPTGHGTKPVGLALRELRPFALPVQTDTSCDQDTFRRINVTRQDAYTEVFENAVEGWLNRANVAVISGLMRAQTRACMVGSIGEIGVHHGKLFIDLLLGALPSERRIAMDLFIQNRDNKTIANAQRFGFERDQYEMIAGDSQLLTAQSFLTRKVPAFRVFSVDGGHDYQLTLNDLNIASMVVRPGAVIIVDDYKNIEYPGLDEAVVDFLAANRRIAPFLYMANKLYLTTADYHQVYYNWADKLPYGPCSVHNAYFKTDAVLRGWNVCIKMYHGSFLTALPSQLTNLTLEIPPTLLKSSSAL